MPNSVNWSKHRNNLNISQNPNFQQKKKWKAFSQKSRIAPTGREKLFPFIFIDFDVKYCIQKGTD